jgi:hypothetical protein
VNKYSGIVKALGPKSLLYFASVILKRVGIEVEESYTYLSAATLGYRAQINKEIECQVITSLHELSSQDIVRMTRFGFVSSTTVISELFETGQSCVVARLNDEFVGVLWMIPCGPYPHHWFSSERYMLLDRASVLPEYRGRKVLITMFQYIIDTFGWGDRLGQPKILCKVWKFNYSSKAVIIKAGFTHVRTTFRFLSFTFHTYESRELRSTG